MSAARRVAVVKMESDILDFITFVAQCIYVALPCVGDSLVNLCFEVNELKFDPQFYIIRKFTTLFITQSHGSQR